MDDTIVEPILIEGSSIASMYRKRRRAAIHSVYRWSPN